MNKDTFKFQISNIINWLPLLYLLQLFFGIVKLYVKYYIFGISIFNYISLSEVVLYTIEELIILIVTLSISSFILLNYLENKKSEPSNKENKQENIRRTKKEYIKESLLSNWAIYLMMILIIIFHIVTALIFNNEQYWRFFISGVLYVLLSFSANYTYIKLSYDPYKKQSLEAKTIRLSIHLYYFLLIFIGYISYIMNQRIKYDKTYFDNYTIVTKDKGEYRTNNNLRLIGKVEKYTFLYNKADDLTIILSNDEIERFEIDGKQRP